MKEAPFAPAITGPIDGPRPVRVDPGEVASALFDEKNRARLEKLARALRFSPMEMIREATIRYMDELENKELRNRPTASLK